MLMRLIIYAAYVTLGGLVVNDTYTILAFEGLNKRLDTCFVSIFWDVEIKAE